MDEKMLALLSDLRLCIRELSSEIRELTCSINSSMIEVGMKMDHKELEHEIQIALDEGRGITG
jgi:hypothetical protein